MKKIIWGMLFTVISLLAVEQKQEGVGWLDVFSWDDSSYNPRILLIGDSIVRQYANGVKNGLKGKYSLTRLSTSKSICSDQYNKQLSIAMTQEYEIILINNGLHDFSSTNIQYKKCYLKALDYLTLNNPNSKIILMATTGLKGQNKRNEIVISRNIILYSIALERKEKYLDLYSVTENKYSLYRDHAHYNRGGGETIGTGSNRCYFGS